MWSTGSFHRLSIIVLLIISSLYQVCQKIGLTGDQTQSLVSKIGDQEVKDKLKETTQKALDMGVGRRDNAQTIFRCFNKPFSCVMLGLYRKIEQPLSLVQFWTSLCHATLRPRVALHDREGQNWTTLEPSWTLLIITSHTCKQTCSFGPRHNKHYNIVNPLY